LVFLSYRYFVDLGLFLASWQVTGVSLDMENAGSTGLQPKSKETLFPETTNYRYSGVPKA
jgi:hypothetical protein